MTDYTKLFTPSGNALSLAGTTFFNTNQPSASAGGGTCGSNLGVARQVIGQPAA